MPITPHGIGVVSSIAFKGTLLETAFREGVGNSAWYDAAVALDRIGNTTVQLREAVKALNDNPNVGLIVTAGGVAPAYAALLQATKPFVSIFGGPTANFPGAPPPALFYGGVTLDTFNRNDDRVNYLTGTHVPNIPIGQICLLANPNSTEAYAAERARWMAAPGPRGQVYDARNHAEVATNFNAFKNNGGQSAMIVSADPFFQDHKEFLIHHANKSGKLVCYPFEVYANRAGTAPAYKGHVRHGPKLAAAYHQLGEEVKYLMDGNAPRAPQGTFLENAIEG